MDFIFCCKATGSSASIIIHNNILVICHFTRHRFYPMQCIPHVLLRTFRIRIKQSSSFHLLRTACGYVSLMNHDKWNNWINALANSHIVCLLNACGRLLSVATGIYVYIPVGRMGHTKSTMRQYNLDERDPLLRCILHVENYPFSFFGVLLIPREIGAGADPTNLSHQKKPPRQQ